MNKPNLILVLKLLPLYAFSGLILAWPWFYAHLSKAEAQASNQQYLAAQQPQAEAPVSGMPVKLEIPRLGISLEVTNGYYYSYNQSWTLSEDKAHYAVMSAKPGNQAGHTLIYGHATKQVLLPTKSLVEGDQLILSLDNGHQLEYFYSGQTSVDPTNTEVVHKQSDKPELTLLTCDGAYFQQRRQMNFTYLRVLPTTEPANAS